MCVYKIHAFIYFRRPPSWSGSSVLIIYSGVHPFSVTSASWLSMASTWFLSLMFQLSATTRNACTVEWFYFANSKICLQVDFYHLAIVYGGLGSIVAFQSPSLSFVVKEFGDLCKNVYGQVGKCKRRFVSAFVYQNFISPLRTVQLCFLHPSV